MESEVRQAYANSLVDVVQGHIHMVTIVVFLMALIIGV